mgnify:CR=1 FL=1
MAYQKEEPLVSVIIPFFNAAQFINATIESVITQSYINWEIILIDDASTDESYQIAEAFVQKFPDKIFLFTHPQNQNKGAAASRNLGFAKSSGDLITFLDSDDLWLPQKLKTQVDLMHSNSEIDVLCEATKYWNSWFDPDAKDYIIPIGAPSEKLYYPPTLAAKLYPLGNGDSFCTCALMLRRQSFEAVEGFDESFTGSNQLFEDQTFFLKTCLTQKVYLSSICNNIYRQRPNSLMHGLIANGHYESALHYFLKWLNNYVKSKSIQSAEISFLLKKAFVRLKYPLFFKILNVVKRVGLKFKKILKGQSKK